MYQNPWEQLKRLPWLDCLKAAAATVVGVGAVDVLILQLVALSPFVEPALMLLLRFGALVWLVTGGLTGMLAVICFERLCPQTRLTAGGLWALVGCVLLGLWIKSWLPVPFLFTGLSYVLAVGVLVGASWRGQAYWRSWRR